MQQKSVLLKNGETLNYYEQGNCKDVLLLIHGNTSSAMFFEPLFEKLPKSIRVIAPDLRGFGKSSYVNKIETLSDFSYDISLFLEALDIKYVDILGWSLGGVIALDFALNYQSMTDALILLSSGSLKGYPIFKKDATGKPLLGQIYESKDALSKDMVQVLPLLNAYQTQNVAFMEYIYDLAIYTGKKPDKEKNRVWMQDALLQRNLVDVDWALANYNASNTPSLYQPGSGKINNLKSKTLIIWGDKDITVPKFMFDENVSMIPDNDHIIYENCGHSIVVDDPERLAIDIVSFI